MGLYDRVKEIALEKGLTIYRIEKDLKFGNGAISKWNNSIPNSENLHKVSTYLDVSMEELLTKKN